uniref:Protein arginine N-methyltransferase n=1 Tax=Phallusia mammillata TaxID=59560 RepID=A0A6F9DQB2_9ASCI|nr:protein arginine N-methyltransferase 5-like [Phallusia mammillata]
MERFSNNISDAYLLQKIYCKTMTRKNKLSCGLDLDFDSNIENALECSSGEGYDFVCLDIVNPEKKTHFLKAASGDKLGDKTKPEFMLIGQEWCSLVVGKVSKWLTLNSGLDGQKACAENAVTQELNFAAYLSLPAVLVYLQTQDCASLAKTIYTHLLTSHHGMTVWVNVPLTVGPGKINGVEEADEENTSHEKQDSWHWWNKFRCLCGQHNRIGLALEITADLPDELVLKQWLGEPIRSVVLPTSVFLTNKKGFPVLSRAHQFLMMQLLRLNCQIVVTGGNEHDSGLRVYQQYVNHLFSSHPPLGQYEAFAQGYEDYLQAPLQPLMDNLESATYETFEKDPIKYQMYEEAIYKCLSKKSKDNKSDSHLVLMVLGAGRGPLVRASLRAARQAKVKVKCYAVEKNANAAVTLELLRQHEWMNDDVTIISSDMRKWKAPELADVIVSELLGSFGDNELSPECLDGAERFLKPDAISIPCNYTSYLSPVSSQKLYNEVTGAGLLDKEKRHDAAFETPYVVRIHNCHELAEPKKVFYFSHPKPKADNNSQISENNQYLSNVRYAELSFDVNKSSMLHGFAGYFHCTLFDDVCISIVPQTHSPGMFSWFPIFFPLLTPISVKQGDVVNVNMWRCCSATKVWYEWAVTEPYTSPIHNPAGRSYTIGL